MKIYCPSNKCNNTAQEHKEVSSSLDKQNGWKVDGIKTQGGCRDSRADYRTTECLNCGRIHTCDFATD